MKTQSRSKQGKQRYGDLNEQIYKFNRRTNTILTRLEDSKNYNVVKLFAQELKLAGLSPGRVWYYASRSAKIVRWFDQRNIPLKNATKENCKECFQHILDPNYKGPTKAAYARILKRLVHFAKTGEIGERTFESDYVDEVRWIRPSKYDSEYKPHVEAEDLLTPDELVSIFRAVPSVSRSPIRDKPMIMCTFEGVFRPGEILQMRVGGIRFESKIAWVKSTGKTGDTDAKPLVIACEPLLQWLKHHPHGSDPDAPVWWSYRTKSVVSLAYLERLIKKAAEAAGIKKNVWAYLLRHTKLTDIAKRHPHEILRKYGNWKRLDMVKVYVHLSSSDLKKVVRKDYGLIDEKKDKKSNALALKRCLQCGETNNPDDARCGKCGIALDADLAAEPINIRASQQMLLWFVLHITRMRNEKKQIVRRVASLNEVIPRREGRVGLCEIFRYDIKSNSFGIDTPEELIKKSQRLQQAAYLLNIDNLLGDLKTRMYLIEQCLKTKAKKIDDVFAILGKYYSWKH